MYKIKRFFSSGQVLVWCDCFLKLTQEDARRNLLKLSDQVANGLFSNPMVWTSGSIRTPNFSRTFF
jgi:hypothetical protein